MQTKKDTYDPKLQIQQEDEHTPTDQKQYQIIIRSLIFQQYQDQISHMQCIIWLHSVQTRSKST